MNDLEHFGNFLFRVIANIHTRRKSARAGALQYDEIYAAVICALAESLIELT
jgi:hypothetical protein